MLPRLHPRPTLRRVPLLRPLSPLGCLTHSVIRSRLIRCGRSRPPRRVPHRSQLSPLGASCSFGILGATPVVSSVGPTIVTGDIGIWPALSITGFPPGTITGVEHLGDSVAMTAQGDLTTAYNNVAGKAGGAVLPADIGGLTLAPGVYRTTSAQPSLGITGNLTLSGNGLYIFQIVSSLTTAAGPGNSNVILAGGAVSHDVFWQVGSSATLGSGSIFQGTILAQASITLSNGRNVERQGAGADRRGLIGQQSGKCTSLPMRYSEIETM